MKYYENRYEERKSDIHDSRHLFHLGEYMGSYRRQPHYDDCVPLYWYPMDSDKRSLPEK